MRRYTVREEIEIGATAEQVYAVATDPGMVPRYAPEITRIDVLHSLANGQQLVRSHIKVGWFSFVYLYRYRYIPARYYGGVQEYGRLFRGYFGLRFRRSGDKTQVVHTEGIVSPIPGLARVVGFIYFRILSRGATGEELRRLKALVERRSVIEEDQHPRKCE